MDTVSFPGMTLFDSYTKPTVSPLTSTPIEDRPVIFLATQRINSSNLFSNGLFQNILIIYDMLEILGFSCCLIVDEKPAASDMTPDLNRYRCVISEEIVRNPVAACIMYIEIGMSAFPPLRKYLKNMGAVKIVKLYLGNIMNIDIETTQMTAGLFFPHHVVGNLDQIWTSPHYGQNREYASVLNNVAIENSNIAPYLWDPCFVTDYGKCGFQWKKPDDWRQMDIVIVEPNISFQKSYLFPLLLANDFAKGHPEWVGKIVLMNCEYIKQNVHVVHSVLPMLEIYKSNRIVMSGRQTIKEIVVQNPSALFIGHQFNNDFNYMTLELMYMGFPLLHCSSAWSDFGYFWSVAEWGGALQTLERAMKKHYDSYCEYISQSRQLAWHHSIHNPNNQKAWLNLIEDS